MSEFKNGFGTNFYCQPCRKPRNGKGKPKEVVSTVSSNLSNKVVSKQRVLMQRLTCGHKSVVSVLGPA